MSYLLLNPVAMGDTFSSLYAKWKANFEFAPNSIVQAGNNVTFYNLIGGVFGTIVLPLAPNVIKTGLVASSVGFTLTVTGGTYQVANIEHLIAGTIQAIPAADPTFNRIDVLVVDNTGNYVYLTGVPSANAVAPTITLNQLAVTYINVPAAGIPVITPQTCCIPNGTTNGQTLRWNQSTGLWEVNNRIISTDATLYLRGDNSFDIGTDGVTNRSFMNGDDFNLSLGVQNGLGVWNELLISNATGFDFNEGATESRLFVGCTGGVKLISTVPTIQTDTLWNDSGLLYWNGDLICTAPCGGGGATVNAGTLEYSTLRWDNGILEWIENKFLLANGSSWTQICCAIAPTTTYGVGNVATGLIFSQGANHTIDSRASLIMACGQNIQITHVPTSSDNGMNIIGGSYTVDINIHPDYQGLNTILGSSNGGIYGVAVPVSAYGHCLILGSENMTINGELAYSGIINCNDSTLNDVYASGTLWSSASVLGTASANQTNTSGVIFSDLGFIQSTHDVSDRCAVIGCSTVLIESGRTCGIYSSVGSEIRGYTGVGAIRCINSAIVGGNTNIIDPTGLANIQQCVIIGGVSNNLTGGTGNCINSAIISSTGCTTTPTGSGSRIVVIGCNGLTATKNNTTYVDGIDTQGSHTYSSVTHVTTNTYNVQAGDHIIACLNTALFVTQTIYLPATPNEGDTYIIENPDGTAGGVGTITIDGNGNNVNGGLTVVLNTAYVSKTARYYAGTVNAWIVGM